MSRARSAVATAALSMQAPRLVDVARVSPITVPRALREPHKVSPQARARVAAPQCTAVFAASEVRAIGAPLECLRRGWKVAGLGAYLVPALTTVRVPRDEIGRRAAQMILDRLEDRPVARPIVDVGFEIVVRESA